MRRTLSSFVFMAAVLGAAPALAQLQVPSPTSCSTTSQNIFVRDQLTAAYYWNQHLPANVSPANFNSPEVNLLTT